MNHHRDKLNYYSSHKTKENAYLFLQQIIDYVSYKVKDYKIQERKLSKQGRKEYDLYLQFGELK